MTFLPVVERELRVGARKRGTYWNRFGAALVAIAVCFWVLWDMRRATPDRVGLELFRSLMAILYVYIAIAGAYATSDSLTTEKRDGTLGLLFLTDLKPYDVILGKLTSNSVSILYRVLSVFPIVALSFLMGGVTQGEMFRSIIAALNLLMVALCLGIFASAACRDGLAAMRLAVIVLLFFLIAPALLEGLANQLGFPQRAAEALNIGFGCFTANETLYQGKRGWFWIHAGYMQALSWTFLWLACRIIPRSWQDRPVDAVSGFRMRVSRWFALRPSARERAAMLEHNPYFWRAKQRQTATIQIWSALGVLVLFWGIAQHYMGLRSVVTTVLPLLVAHLIIKLVAAGEASRAIADDRHSGAMELLLTTPLSTDEIVRGQGRAFFLLMAAPVALVIALDTFCLIAGLKLMSRSSDNEVLVALYFVSVGALVLDIIAASWTGLWLGLSARSALRATSGTIMRILVLPVLIFMLLSMIVSSGIGMSFGGVVFLWAAICFICDVGFMTRSQALLQGRFRSIVAGE